MLDLSKYITNNTFSLHVVPSSGRQELVIDKNGKLRLFLKSQPEHNKANLELIKFFKKEYKVTVEIVQGKRAHRKVLHLL